MREICLWISRSMGVDLVSCSRWIARSNVHVDVSSKVLLFGLLWRSHLWWTKHSWDLVERWCKFYQTIPCQCPDYCPKSELPEDDIFPHSYLPLHFWLDKGLVTRRVKKYPMILRPAWLPRQIRNASGNGGGVLIGYMPVVSYKCLFKDANGILSDLEWV